VLLADLLDRLPVALLTLNRRDGLD
jgi:hypothetical protein